MEYAANDFRTMTEQVKLTKELISLVHFVELNESGWVKKTLGKIVLSILCRSSSSLDRSQIHAAVTAAAAHDFGQSTLNKCVDWLISQGQILERPKGAFRVRESVLKDIEAAIKATEAEERSTEATFVCLLKRFAPDLDGGVVWSQFLELFLLPLIRGAGANTLNLLSGAAPLGSKENLQPFLDILPSPSRDDVHRTVVEFLDPTSADIRQFILKRVAASFFVAAVSLDSSTVEALDKKRNTHSSIRLFLDTNTLFSVLGLHEHEANDGVQSLVALNKNPDAPVKVKLFAFPETIDEATRVLSGASNSMGANSYPQQLAKAALRTNISGVHASYLKAAAKTSEHLSPRDYFSPYIKNFAAILKQRGIEVIDRKLLVDRQDQDVIDDVVNSTEWEKRLPEERRKPYEAMFHDIYVWHCVNRQRELQLTSPLEAKEWFVTLDRRLIWFDAYKGKGSASWVPTCIDPSTFIQYAQFWTPRTAQFETALFGSLRLPLLFKEFDSDTEDVSLAIINRLSRIEGVGDFTSDEIHTLLLNDAVRTRFRESPSDVEQTELVRDELLAIHKQTVEKSKQLELDLSHERVRKDALVSQLKLVTQTTASEKLELLASNDKSQSEIRKQTDAASCLQQELEAAKAKLMAFELASNAERVANERKQRAYRFFLLNLLTPFVSASILFATLASYLFTPVRAVGVGLLLGAGAAAGVCKLTSREKKCVSDTPWLRRVCKALTVGWALGVGGVYATSNALYSNFWSSHQNDIVRRALATTTLGAENSKVPASSGPLPADKTR